MVVTQLSAQRAAQEGERRDWWQFAACREADPELFFPVAAHGPGAEEIARAKEFCAGCGVRRECLQYAIATRQLHGVWGGTSEEERKLHGLHARRGEDPGRAGAGMPRQRPGLGGEAGGPVRLA